MVQSWTSDAAVLTIGAFGRADFVSPQPKRELRGLSKIVKYIDFLGDPTVVIDGQHRWAGILAIVEEAAADTWSWAQASLLTLGRTTQAYIGFAMALLKLQARAPRAGIAQLSEPQAHSTLHLLVRPLIAAPSAPPAARAFAFEGRAIPLAG